MHQANNFHIQGQLYRPSTTSSVMRDRALSILSKSFTITVTQ